MAELPPPLLPADVDLRGNDWMPLYGDRLFNSETWIEAGHEGRCAALKLWWQAFAKEKPAASLPDNDKLLSVYAGYGEAVKVWRKVKPEAMRGWISCSDGRLWHPVVAEIAAEAWERRQDSRETQEAKNERQKRWRERVRKVSAALRERGVKPPRGASLETLEKMARDAGVDVSTLYVDVATPSAEIAKKGQERTGQERKEDTPPAAASPVIPPKAEAAAADEDDLAFPQHLRRAPDGPQAAMASRDVENEAHALWLAFAEEHGVEPGAQFLNSAIRPMLAARLAECDGIDGWKLALEKAQFAEFLRKDGGWQWWFDLDWMLKPNNFSRLIGGRYAKRHEAHREPNGGAPTVADGIAAAFSRRYPATG